MRRLCFVFAILWTFSFGRTEINVVEKDALLNRFIEYLNNLPKHGYGFQEGILLSAQEADDGFYTIQVKLKERETEKYSRCSCTLKLQGNGVLIQGDVYSCMDYEEPMTESDLNPDRNVESNPATAVGDVEASEGVSEPPAAHKAVELDNEIRPNTETTSGEQFVAIPREEPIRRNSAVCIGCGSRVDPTAPGVADLAAVGIKQLDRQEPHIKHSLNKVVEVERQVQVVNGVRYIITLLVDINNCTSSEESLCIYTKPCKVSILEKPWIKFPNGAKYRAILSNNCTEQWLFGDNGDIVSDGDDRMDDSISPTPDYDKIANTGSSDDILKAIYNKDLQSQQSQKGLNEQEIKNLEEQIIPHNQFHAISDPFISVTESSDHADVSKHTSEVGASKHYSDDSNTNNQDALSETSLPEDKKKAIDDLMNFFDFAGYTTKDKRQTSRRKRSYENDIQIMSLVKEYEKVKESLNNAKNIYGIAQVMVDYLNEVYYEKNNRTLKEVISAEEEFDNDHRFIYLQARVVKPHKDVTKNKLKICNGVLDITNIDNPKVLSAFCFDDGPNKSNYNVPVPLPADDFVLQNLMNKVLNKMESESPNENAIKVSKIISASTQQGSGILTKVSAIFVLLNCSKNTPLMERNYCVEMEDFGSKICEIEIFQRAWLRATEITQNCIETQIDESFSDVKKSTSVNNINDQKNIEFAQQALSYLESQSDRNNRQKILRITSVLTQRVAGVLTSVDFVVGYTDCKNGIDVDIKNCNILRNETFRYCTVKVWQRPWLEDGNEMKVFCNDNYTDTNYLNPILSQHAKKHQQNVNPEDEYYDNVMAKLSLEKYIHDSGITHRYEVASVDSVKLSVGEITTSKIDFTIRSLDNDTLIHLVKCHSLIEFRTSIDSKNITVDCDFDDQIFGTGGIGGTFEKDPNNQIYRALAEESMHHYLQSAGVKDEHEVISVDKVTHQLVSGSVTNLDFKIKPVSNSDKADSLSCHSRVFERQWLNEKQIEVNCEIYDEKVRNKRHVTGGVSDRDPNDPEYKILAEESMQKYLTSVGETRTHKVISVDKVTYQVVAGSLTKLNFTIKPDSDGDVIKCHSEVWEQPWLNKKDIKVDCEIKDQKLRTRRELVGGETKQDPNDPEYKILAEESMQKYLTSVGETRTHKVISVDKVTYQVVAGSLTKLDFTIKPVSKGDVIKCHSEVWEQPWLNKKDIKVACEIKDQKLRTRRELVGGETKQDPNDPEYKILAEESMQKYLTSVGETRTHKVISVDKVTYQVVAGSLTKLDFTIKPVSKGDVIKCHSEVWEQPWLNKKDIKVDCEIKDQKLRTRRELVGGETKQDPNDPEYKILAEESMQKYLTSVGETRTHKVISVDKVTYQVVAGSLTKLDFTIKPVSKGDVIKCHSEVWEQPWLNKKDIKVDCEIKDQKLRTRRELVGGETKQDPNDPEYKILAEESMQKYLTSVGETRTHKVISVDKVTYQVVAGSLTKLDFTIKPVSKGDVIKCHSEVWEQPWLNKKDIKVDCEIKDQKLRTRRELVGGETKQDPNDPEYKILAEESMQKYLTSVGETRTHKVISVDKVTYQVVAGSLTKLDFTIKPESDGDVIKCHSEVWEQPWLNKKDIKVNCEIKDQKLRTRRQLVLGETKQDPNNLEYKALAEESMQKYLTSVGETRTHKVISVDKVTYQVVAGSLTKLDFTIKPVSKADVIKCHSKVFEKKWLNEKTIDVKCEKIDDKLRNKRHIFEGEMNPNDHIYKTVKSFQNVNERRSSPIQMNKHKGGLVEQDPTNSDFFELAKDSLEKYQHIMKTKSEHVVLEVKKVTTQVVAGIMYRINFIAKRTSCAPPDVKRSLCNEANENNFLFCFSKIWSRPWLKQKKIDVSCYNEEILEEDYETNNETQKIKKFKLGLKEKKDVDNIEYEDMATLALNKYIKKNNLKYGYKVNKIYHVTEQVTAGVTTNIDFAALPDHCIDAKCPDMKFRLHCQSEIFERPGGSSTKEIISVICKRKINKPTSDKNNRALRGKRNIDIDDNDIEEELKYYYADLALARLNNQYDADNMYKLISIHALQSTMQMRNTIVLMYLEVALTYCLKQEHNELSDCDEMEGLQHRLCYARLYPTNDDERIVKHVSVVCDDDDDFEELTGLSIPYLLRASIKYIEDDPNISNKIINVGPPYVIPSLDSRVPLKINLMVTTTNCSKTVDVLKYNGETCLIDHAITPKTCNAYIFMTPNTNKIKKMDVRCYKPELRRTKRSVSVETNSSSDALEIRKLAELALHQLEMESLHRYKQKILEINNYSIKVASRKHTDIDFEVGYTSCIKYEWVDDLAKCELLGHLPRRLCHAKITETLFNDNGQKINVNCTDDETPLEAHVEFNNVETAELLANEALRYIEAKYPHPRKQKVARIFSLEKQSVAGLHYRLKMEVGLTNCSALSSQDNCQIVTDAGLNKFCRVNVWIRPWVQHSSLYRVTCDYQNDNHASMYAVIQAQHLFFEFIETYKPYYMDNEIEMQKRFKIFRDNVKKIHELNTHELGTATYGVTRFADLSYEEFSSKYLGLNMSLRNENNIPFSQAQIPKVESIPAAFDWREHGAVTEVKDQGSCGSCWAFSVTGNIEGQWKLKKGELVSLSEQELVDCDKLDDGCNGGLPDNAYRAIEQLGGLEQENDYPYEGEDDKCAFNKTMARVQISGAVNITSNETDMAKWLVKNGPISIGINANAMQFYMGGVSHPWKMLCSPKNLDHGVLIVGYGIKEYPLFNKKLPYWTIKNSWGPSWGEQGYYRVFRGDGTCGVNQMASSAIV